MSEHPTFTVDPWAITETRLDVDHLARTETIFALSNGHIGLRGNLDEGEPHGVPGSYLNGVFETFPLPYAEDAYAYPREGQSLIDVHNGKHLRLLVDDEPLDVRLGTLEHHERTLDLRAGVLRRELVWTSPSGKTVRVRSTRLVSFSHRSVAAVEYVVESVGRRPGSSCSRCWRPTSRSPRRAATPGPRPRCGLRSSASSTTTTASR